MYEKRRQSLALKTIKQHLSEEKFKKIKIKNIENIPDLADIITYYEDLMIRAKIVGKKTIHLRMENLRGFVYEGFTENYIWFLDTFSFEE